MPREFLVGGRMVCQFDNSHEGGDKRFFDAVSGYMYNCPKGVIKKGLWHRPGLREVGNDVVDSLLQLEPAPRGEAYDGIYGVDVMFKGNWDFEIPHPAGATCENPTQKVEEVKLRRCFRTENEAHFVDDANNRMYKWRWELTEKEIDINQRIADELESTDDPEETFHLKKKFRRDQTLWKALKMDESRWTRPEFLDRLILLAAMSDEQLKNEVGIESPVVKIHVYSRKVVKSGGKVFAGKVR